jgi:hypothetical protein
MQASTGLKQQSLFAGQLNLFAIVEKSIDA